MATPLAGGASPVNAPTLFAPRARGAEAGAELTLEPDEAGHVRALRLRTGDAVQVADGAGGLWVASLTDVSAEAARCRLARRAEPPAGPPLHLAFGVANKSRTLWLVEKAVELGTRELQPLEFARSRSVADAARSRGFWEKARRRAVSAMKQCGGARVPALLPVRELEEWLEAGAWRSVTPEAEASKDPAGEGTAGAGEGGGIGVLASADAPETLARHLTARGWRGGTPLTLVIGPEGGLEDGEDEACVRAGLAPVSLGPRTLRFETAAVAGSAVAAQMVDGSDGAAERP